jgi:hypothetical protein
VKLLEAAKKRSQHQAGQAGARIHPAIVAFSRALPALPAPIERPPA